jgi:hypothetical protein
MTSTAKTETRDMIWEYPKEEGKPFVLRGDSGALGWLDFHEEPEATIAAFGADKWVFRYTTRLRPRVTIYQAESNEPVAEFVPSILGGGIVSFASGARYRWKKFDLLHNRWCFRHLHNKSAVCLQQEAGPLAEGGKVSMCCGAAEQPETPILLLLAWFLRILDFEMLVEGVFRIG